MVSVGQHCSVPQEFNAHSHVAFRKLVHQWDNSVWHLEKPKAAIAVLPVGIVGATCTERLHSHHTTNLKKLRYCTACAFLLYWSSTFPSVHIRPIIHKGSLVPKTHPCHKKNSTKSARDTTHTIKSFRRFFLMAQKIHRKLDEITQTEFC